MGFPFIIPHQFLSVNRGITVRCTHACNISKRRSRPDSVCYYFSPSKVLRFSRKSQKTAKFGPIGMNGIWQDSVEKSPKKPKTQPSLDLSSTAIFDHRDTIQTLKCSQKIRLLLYVSVFKNTLPFLKYGRLNLTNFFHLFTPSNAFPMTECLHLECN